MIVAKKPPHHLQPIENFDESDESMRQKQIVLLNQLYNSGLNTDRKISIPLNSSLFKDKDHINLDINLKLVDFMPNTGPAGGGGGGGGGNRSYDDFDVNNDPLSKHIRRFENISRSLPGSSGSLNKTKPLPPVNKTRTQNYINQDTARLQHEHEMSDMKTDGIIDNSNRIFKNINNHSVVFFLKEGYLARLQKAQNKPVIKTYTLKDYRNFKKDVNPNTGRLGFDFENETYKKTVCLEF